MILNKSEFNRQISEATRRGNERLNRVPVATAVRYNRRVRKIVIELSNGCTLLVPPELAQELAGAKPGDLAAVRILGPGTSIEWPKLDVQLSVEGLLAGSFGTAAWMASREADTLQPLARPATKKRRATKANR
jgi:hypothetical protein